MTVLPSDGQTNWGDPLNAFILALQALETSTETSLSNHASNSPADPHGDRAFSQALVTPITSGTNLPNGYVKLNSSGNIPADLITGVGGVSGIFTNVFDAVATYSAVPNTGTTQVANLNAAFTACQSAGGGIVYIGPGTFSVDDYMVLPNNCMVLMTPSTVIQRIHGSSNAPYIFSNVRFGTNNTPSTNVAVIGGKLDAVGSGNLSSACTPLFLIQASNSLVRDVKFNTVFNNPCVVFNGCAFTSAENLTLDGTGSNSTTASAYAITVNPSTSALTPVGLAAGFYNNNPNRTIRISNSFCVPTGFTNPFYGGFAGSPGSGNAANTIRILGNQTNDNSAGNAPVKTSVFTNWRATGNLWNDFQTGNDGWHNMTLTGSWNNSGIGANAQYRMLEDPPNTVEIIGDISGGNTSDGTVMATIPSAYRPASVNVFPIALASGSLSASFNFRLSVNPSGQLQCNNIAGITRLAFHAFISLDA